jgi:thioredoxin 2
MTATSTHIVCPHCAGVNRIPAGKPVAKARCGVCHKPLFEGHAAPVTSEHFDRHIGRSDIPVVVDFWAEWCGPCKAMAPFYEQAARELEPDFRFLKLDTDRAPELSARYGIRGIPTVIVFTHGKEAARRSGAMDATTLRNWLTSLSSTV